MINSPVGRKHAATGWPDPVLDTSSMKVLPMRALIDNFLQDESGPAMVEYGLLLALIALVVAASAQIIGTQLNVVFSKIGAFLTTVASTTA